MTTETRTNSAARKVKIVSFLCIVAGLIGWIVTFAVEAPAAAVGLFSLLFFAGFIAFVVGRFME